MTIKTKSDNPLSCEVEGEQLVIRINVSRLVWASKKRNGGILPNNIRVVNKKQWAEDMAREIMKEDEVGNFMLAKILDEAMRAAMDGGSAALVYPKIKKQI